MAVVKKLVLSVCIIASCAANYTNEYGPDYGDDWVVFLDENGTTHTVNFSSLPSDTRGLIFGDAYFYLYSSRNQDAPEELIIPEGETPIASEYFDPCSDIAVLAHGWQSSANTAWVQNVKKSLLKTYSLNVITVDWNELAKNPIYPWSAFNTRYVGRRIAKLLASLFRTYNVGGNRTHLIGHSLGAQVMGYAGMFSSDKVFRITGLDPARPLFEVPYMGKDYRLEMSDAQFVDIIHTGGGVLGYEKSHGHADFYPNEGKPRQPGCEGTQAMIESCSHGRACEFFWESIESKIGFNAYPCENWKNFENGECKEHTTQMGYPALPDDVGNYYLRTSDEYEYAKV